MQAEKKSLIPLSAMEFPAKCFRLASSVFLVPVLDGSARLLDLNGRFFAISTVGADMLRLTIDQGQEAAVRTVSARYSQAPEQVSADLRAFLRELEKAGLIMPAGGHDVRPVLRRVLARCLMASALCGVNQVKISRSRVWLMLALAKLSFALCGWSATVDACTQPHRPDDQHTSGDQVARIVDTVDKAVRHVAARHPFPIECKERALCCWVLARQANVPAELIVGVCLYPFEAHCWCEVNARTFSDERDQCERFQAVARYM
jgi:hypothetical protein